MSQFPQRINLRVRELIDLKIQENQAWYIHLSRERIRSPGTLRVIGLLAFIQRYSFSLMNQEEK